MPRTLVTGVIGADTHIVRDVTSGAVGENSCPPPCVRWFVGSRMRSLADAFAQFI